MASVTAVNRPGVLIVAAVALASMAATVLPWPTVMFYNPSSSAPRGWYLRRPLHHLRPGALVLAHLPPVISTFAQGRGYLPRSVQLLKHVGAVAPQCVNSEERLLGEECVS